MISKLLGWLDDRTGYKELLNEALYERVPGGARWRYVWGSTLVFTFSLQVISGIFLWTAYSPSAQTAWESVYYIQNVMYLGNIVRGMHHFAAQAMVVLLAIHLIQVIIDGAYRAPREVNFWLGIGLMQVILGLSLTGYLLPWDQKGYYATQVSTKIMGATPIVGPDLQNLVQGGPEYGHHTLTRFFAMHAGILPGLLIALLGLHIYVFRRHGITVKDPNPAADTTFWPDQVLKDGVACLAVLAVVLLLAVYKGAELGAPADTSEAYAAARPEWYYLFLFRFLRFKAVEHFGLAFGAIYVPGIIMTILTAMPLIAYWKGGAARSNGLKIVMIAAVLAIVVLGVAFEVFGHEWGAFYIPGIILIILAGIPLLSRERGGHHYNVVFTWAIAFVICGLTALAFYDDSQDAGHQQALHEAERDAHRVHELAARESRIPVAGAVELLRGDPLTQGPRLFAKSCASCHRYDGHDGRGRTVVEVDPQTQKTVRTQATAIDLGDFATREWMRAAVVDFTDHFAPIKNSKRYKDSLAAEEQGAEDVPEYLDPDNSEMADWSGDKELLLSAENEDNLNALIEFLVAEAGHGGVEVDAELVTKGRDVAVDGTWAGDLDGTSCAGCHDTIGNEFEVQELDEAGYPDLAKYGSAKWLKDFIRDPGSNQHYGPKNQMPGFSDKLSEKELDLLVRWLTKDYYPSTLEAYPPLADESSE